MLTLNSSSDMVPRKSHKKSRNGCTTCKSRKVKCDETHPSCRNCTRRNTKCFYNSTILSTSVVPKTPFVMGSAYTSDRYVNAPIPIGSQPVNYSHQCTVNSHVKSNGNDYDSSTINNHNIYKTNPNLLVLDYEYISENILELVEFIFNDFERIISPYPIEQQKWKIFIKKAFYKSSPLKHAFMAIASLYKYYSDSRDDKYLEIGGYHYSKCLASFRSNLTSDTYIYEECREGLFISVSLSIYLAASGLNHIHEVTFFKMVRGVEIMFKRAASFDHHYDFTCFVVITRYSPLVYNSDIDSHTTPHSPQYLRELCHVMPFESLLSVQDTKQLKSLNLNFEEYTPIKAGRDDGCLFYESLYQRTVETLLCQYYLLYHNIDNINDYLPILIRWILSTPKEFDYLLSVNDPRALILVAHFIILLLSTESVWWSDAIRGELAEIVEKLPPNWQSWFKFNLKAHCSVKYEE